MPERILASYYDTGGDHSERHQVYQDEQELMTALDLLDQED